MPGAQSMPQIYTLNDIYNIEGEAGAKLGEKPFNRYPSNRAELEEQLSCAIKIRKKVIESTKRLIVKHDVLSEENKRIQEELRHSQKENESVQEALNHSKKENDSLYDEIKRIKNSLDHTITEREDLKHQAANRYEALVNENKVTLKEIGRLSEVNSKLQSAIDKEHKTHVDGIASLESELSDKLKEVRNLRTEVLSLQGKLSSSRDHSTKVYSEYIKKNLDLENEIWHLKDEIASNQRALSKAASLLKEFEARLADHELTDISKRGDETTRSSCLTSSEATSDPPSLTLPFAAIAGGLAEKALASDGSIIVVPPMIKLVIFVLLALLIIWYVYELIYPRRSSGSEGHDTLIPVTVHPGEFIRGSIKPNYYSTQAEYRSRGVY